MSQQAEAIGDKVLTLNFLSERPEAQEYQGLEPLPGSSHWQHVLTVGKEKDIKSEVGEFKLHGNYEAGKALL